MNVLLIRMTALLKQTVRTPKARLLVLAVTDIKATTKLVKVLKLPNGKH